MFNESFKDSLADSSSWCYEGLDRFRTKGNALVSTTLWTVPG
jgi:hypothetical protein